MSAGGILRVTLETAETRASAGRAECSDSRTEDRGTAAAGRGAPLESGAGGLIARGLCMKY